MGGAVGKETKVTKEQVLSATADAFEHIPRGGFATIEDIVKAAVLAGDRTPTRLDRWKTTSCDMSSWSLKPHHQLLLTPRSNQTPRPNPFVSGGRSVTGNPHSGYAGMSWQAAISSGSMTRDARMGKIRNLFESLDQDDNNIVTVDEFVAAMGAEGIPEREARTLFLEMDDSRTGRLTLAKFDHYVAVHTMAIVRSSFKKLDASHDRQIKRKEFVMFFTGNGLSKRQVHRLWDAMDKNGNGKINFVEYRDWASETLEGTSLDQVATRLGMSVGS